MIRKLLLILVTVSVVLASSGDKAYTFTLPSLNKGVKTVSMPKKGVVLLNIWASWCPGCKHEMPLLDAVAKKYKAKKFKLIAVNVDNKEKSAKKYLKKFVKKLGHKPTIMFAYDTKKSVAKSYKTRAFPMSVLIKNGVVMKEYLGSFNDSNKGLLHKDIVKALQ